MATKIQLQELSKKINLYSKQYLRKELKDLDESGTRLMVNSFLTNVLGYTELDEIKTEYGIKGGYADYVIQLKRKRYFIIEVKSIQLKLSENHLRQSRDYAANEGVEWVILMNGRELELYKVIFSKPINTSKIFSVDLSNQNDVKAKLDFLYFLTKRSVVKDELNSFWNKFEALNPLKMSQLLYSSEITRLIRKSLKEKTGLNFVDSDIQDAIHKIIITKIDSIRPKQIPSIFKQKKVIKKDNGLTLTENKTEKVVSAEVLEDFKEENI